jgi:hypothetical protein
MRLRPLLTACLFAFLPHALHAQLALYGSFTTQRLNVPGFNSWINGGTFGTYLASGHFAVLSVGVDARGSFATGGGTSFDSGAIGPRLGFNMHILPVQPYIEATAGVGHAAFSGLSSSDVTKFEYQFLGGLDYTVLPRVDWRVVEFSYGGLTGLNTNSFHPKSISTGIVLRLPRIWAAIP